VTAVSRGALCSLDIMANLDNPTDTPTEWARDHLQRYVETDGREGHHWRGVPTLLLTTRGRKSGQARRTPLIYGQDGDRYIIVASLGGAPQHPLWYNNLTADPKVRIQVGDRVLDATARTATDEEKPTLWRVMTGIWPDYDSYQAKTERQIPVVVLEPDA
jgi:deazaflavin-dependent oxidoreductase (nitroreductase family)